MISERLIHFNRRNVWRVPRGFSQLVTFNCRSLCGFFLLCFILFNAKKEIDYTEAFKPLANLTKCNFKNVVINYEIALINALRGVFIEAGVYGCSFHYGQSLWRQIQKDSSVEEYKHNKEYYDIIRMCPSHIFAGVCNVDFRFENVKLIGLNLNCENYQKI